MLVPVFLGMRYGVLCVGLVLSTHRQTMVGPINLHADSLFVVLALLFSCPLRLRLRLLLPSEYPRTRCWCWQQAVGATRMAALIASPGMGEQTWPSC